MSLSLKEAVIAHDRTVSLQTCIDTIDTLGFTCAPQMGKFADTVISIEGMTCISCVRNIEATVGRQPGVKFIKVSLDQKLGYVRYDADLITDEMVRQAIDDMGFEASFIGNDKILNTTNGSSDAKNEEMPKLETCLIHVEGMTCQSCVHHIEQVVRETTGVKSVLVSLERKEATIVYDKSLIQASKLCTLIDDMGYEASWGGEEEFDELARMRGGCGGDVPLPKDSAIIRKELVAPDMNTHADSVRLKEELSKLRGVTVIDMSLLSKKITLDCLQGVYNEEAVMNVLKGMMKSESSASIGQSVLRVKIGGMTCQSCVKLITSAVKDMPGITGCNVVIGEGTFNYIPDKVTANEIMAKISSLDFVVDLAESEAVQKKIRIDLDIRGMHSSACVRIVEEALGKVSGVLSAKVSLIEEVATVIYNEKLSSVDKLMHAVKSAGAFQVSLKS